MGRTPAEVTDVADALEDPDGWVALSFAERTYL